MFIVKDKRVKIANLWQFGSAFIFLGAFFLASSAFSVERSLESLAIYWERDARTISSLFSVWSFSLGLLMLSLEGICFLSEAHHIRWPNFFISIILIFMSPIYAMAHFERIIILNDLIENNPLFPFKKELSVKLDDIQSIDRTEVRKENEDEMDVLWVFYLKHGGAVTHQIGSLWKASERVIVNELSRRGIDASVLPELHGKSVSQRAQRSSDLEVEFVGWLIVALSALVLIAIIPLLLVDAINYKLHKKKNQHRFEQLKSVGDNLGLTITYRQQHKFFQRTPISRVLKDTRSNKLGFLIRNILEGTVNGWRLFLCDYIRPKKTLGESPDSLFSYAIEKVEEATESVEDSYPGNTVLVINIEDKKLPSFYLAPQNISRRIIAFVRYGHERAKWQRRYLSEYVLMGDKYDELKVVFGFGVLMSLDQWEPLCIKSNGRQVAFYKDGVVVSAKDIKKVVCIALNVIGLMINAKTKLLISQNKNQLLLSYKPNPA